MSALRPVVGVDAAGARMRRCFGRPREIRVVAVKRWWRVGLDNESCRVVARV